MLFSMKLMQEHFTRTIGTIKISANSIATATQIAAGNQDLSQRTIEQSTSLKETAWSMEESTSTVHHNTENARQATTHGEHGLEHRAAWSTGSVGPIPCAASSSLFHRKGGRRASWARHCLLRRQGGATRHCHASGADLRTGLAGLFVRFPTWSQTAKGRVARTLK